MIRKIFKKPVLWLVCVGIFLGVLLWRAGYIPYRAVLAWQKLIIYSKSVKVSDVVLRPDLPDSISKGLATSKDILTFAKDSLGLETSFVFDRFYENPKSEMAFLVVGSPVYKLKILKYGFPLLDSLDYVVFFDNQKAKDYEKTLIHQGLDTRIDVIEASQLYGSELSSRLFNRSQAGLATIIFYQLIKNKLQKARYKGLLKSMATFLSEKATLIYMRHKAGVQSSLYVNFYNNLQDYSHYSKHILNGAAQLDSLYNTFNDSSSVFEKQYLKQKTIFKIISKLDTIRFHFPEIYLNHFADIGLPNNTYFLSYIDCRSNHSIFEREFADDFNCNFKKYLAGLKTKK